MKSYKDFNEEGRIAPLRINESKTLKDWVLSDVRSKSSVLREYPQLSQKYPFDGGKLYRGMNFASAAAYMEFRRSVRDGYYKEDMISSWSPHQNEAQSYAVSRMVHNLDYGTALLYDAMTKSKERIMGFVGVIVVVTVPRGIGIDLQKSGHGLETEVILGPGSYKIDQIILEKKYKHLLKDVDINVEVMEILNGRREQKDEDLRALFHYKGAQILPEVKEAIANKAVSQITKNFRVSVRPHDFFGDTFAHPGEKKTRATLYPDGVFDVHLVMTSGIEYLLSDEEFNQYVSPELADKFRRMVVKKLDEALKPYENLQVGLRFGNPYHNRYFTKKYSVGLNDTHITKKIVSSTYHRINDIMRRMNREPDIADLAYLIDELKTYANDNWSLI